MRHGLELHRGRAEPIATVTEVSGTRDSGVSSTVTTTFELDGCAVEYGGVVPFLAGDDVVVAGRRDDRGVLKAYAVRLPRQGVMLGSSSGHRLGAAVVLAVAAFVLLVKLPGLVGDLDASASSSDDMLVVGLVGLLGLVLGAVGVSLLQSAKMVDHARVMVMRVR